MSMTQIAFLTAALMPSCKQIQETVQNLGYDFKILGDLEHAIGIDGLDCTIDGYQTYFETYINKAAEIEDEGDWIKPDLTDQDIAISFIWGADFAAGACIGLISVALIECANALIYYMDDQMKYTRDMLLADTPIFLGELKKG